MERNPYMFWKSYKKAYMDVIGPEYVYASGPKTVLVKSTFLGFPTKLVFGPLARLGWGGVGWGGVGWGVITFFHLRPSCKLNTLSSFFLNFHTP